MTPQRCRASINARASTFRALPPGAAQPEDPPGHLRRHRPGFTLIQYASLVEHDDFSAILGLVEIGRAPNDTDPLLDQLVNHPPQLAARDRIDTHAGLIEQQQPRRAQHGAGKAELLLHAS